MIDSRPALSRTEAESPILGILIEEWRKCCNILYVNREWIGPYLEKAQHSKETKRIEIAREFHPSLIARPLSSSELSVWIRSRFTIYRQHQALPNTPFYICSF